MIDELVSAPQVPGTKMLFSIDEKRKFFNSLPRETVAKFLNATPGGSDKKTIVVPPKPKPPTPKTKYTLTLKNKETYSSNALSAPSDHRADNSLSIAPTLVITHKLSDANTLSFESYAAYLRYAKLDSLERDTYSGKISFVHTLSDGLAPALFGKLPKGASEKVAARFQARSSVRPDGEGSAAIFYTPTLEWALSDVPIGTSTCKGPKNSLPCITTDVTVTVDHTWREAADQNNASVAVGANINWNFTPGILVITASSRFGGRDYENAADGRADASAAFGASLKWTPTANSSDFVATFGVEFATQDSSRSSARYDGFTASPGLSLSMALN
ncbi:hypothetical protein [Hyphomicrobium sp. LHD-15]|uniref:hypothetical protein n=1 Tax=Hyphomicrobium sp. LHD-15 TaxID=3072142 RepID=UPI00280FBB9B|nr:hypothetical protein [Hyphomicrobium sp. LHD-15]MDQ8697217.1 hypothetical protein [Hyphomicrobium sp. LHD-15]